MIYSELYNIQLKDIEKEKYIKDRGILEIFENAATHHSDIVGFGVNDIETTKTAWILMDWKVQVIKRPKYGEKLKVYTWVRTINGSFKKTYTYRDFEMYDEKNNLLAIGTSKWVLIDIKTGKITTIADEIFERYKPEDKSVFEEQEIEKVKIPESYSNEISYQVTRRDVDFNNHMHNLYYLDLAYNALPNEVYDKRPFDNFRICYKREIKLNDIVKCKYSFVDGEHIISVFSEDNSKLHSIIKIKE